MKRSQKILIVISAILLAVTISQGIRIYKQNKAIEALFYYDVQFSTVDDITGETVRGSMSISSSSNDIIKRKFRSNPDKTTKYSISGYASGSMLIVFEAEGYQSKTIDLSKNNSGEVTVKMRAKSN